MKKLLVLLSIVLVLLTVLAACSQPAPAPSPTPPSKPATSPSATTAPSPSPSASPKPSPSPEKIRALMGTTSASSSNYVFGVEWAKILNKYVPGMDVTPVETSGTVEDYNRLDRGEFAFTIFTPPDTQYTAMNGLGSFVGKPPTKARLLFTWALNIQNIYVREDSGIKTLADLNGKKFNPGPAGSIATNDIQRIIDALGIKPDWYVADWGEAVTAVQQNRLVGYFKAGTNTSIDAGTMELLTKAKLRIIPFTKADIEKVKKTLPWITWIDLPAGYWKQFSDTPAYSTFVYASTAGVHADMISEEMGYQIMKASIEHQDELAAGFKPATAFKFLDKTMEIMNGLAVGVPWHTGAIKYLKEKGLQIRSDVLPPEMKK